MVTVAEQFEVDVRECVTHWNLENQLPSKQRRKGEAILLAAARALTPYLGDFEKLPRVTKPLEAGITGLLEAPRMSQAIGPGPFRAFWEAGDEAFRLLKETLHEVKKMQSEVRLRNAILEWLNDVAEGRHPNLKASDDIGDQELCAYLKRPVSELAPEIERLADADLIKATPLYGDGEMLSFMCNITIRGQEFLKEHADGPRAASNTTTSSVTSNVTNYGGLVVVASNNVSFKDIHLLAQQSQDTGFTNAIDSLAMALVGPDLQLSEEVKAEMLDLVQAIAEQGALPPAERKPARVKAWLRQLSENIQSLDKVGHILAEHLPAIAAFFGIGS